MKHVLSAVRGLVLGLSLSILNLIGLFFMLLLLGGLGGWSTMQFVGAFGIFEIATAIAFLFCPNVWRLPVIQAKLGQRDTELSASTVFIPHWAGGSKAIAGVAMLFVAARSEGVDLATLGIVPFAVSVAVMVVAISAAAARFGTWRPDLDVVQFILRRPSHKDLELPGLSISAAVLQIVMGTFTLPTVKLLPPDTLFRPEVGPSAVFLAATILAAVLSVAGAFWAWWGRLSLRAPRRQQAEAEKPA